MITLSNTKYGTKRKAIISGFSQWDHLNTFAEVLFYVQLLDANNVLLSDKSVNQNRAVTYSLSNNNKVDLNFNPSVNGTGEYDYFFNLVSIPPQKSGSTEKMTIVDILILLGEKLKTRGIFE